jgi:hypothetical protein
MSGRTRTFTTQEIEEDTADEMATPNLVVGAVYWLSSKQGREFAPMPVRARRAQDAAKRAVRWIGGPVLVWENDPHTSQPGAIVWCEWPAVATRSTERSMRHFSYVP